nr:hypothetical protein [Tanacetum cinerariifolium]
MGCADTVYDDLSVGIEVWLDTGWACDCVWTEVRTSVELLDRGVSGGGGLVGGVIGWAVIGLFGSSMCWPNGSVVVENERVDQTILDQRFVEECRRTYGVVESVSSYFHKKSNPRKPEKPPMPLISSFTMIEKSADEHEICDGYLTEKKQQQLLLDEEALREALEEARAEKKSTS